MNYLTATDCFSSARYPEKGKPIANNTRVFRRGEDYAVRLHATDVVTFHPDGSFTLDSDGWRTVTTKARMNDYIPAGRIYTVSGVWYFISRREDERVVYFDGIHISEDGRVLNPERAPVDLERYGKMLTKSFHKYVNGFAKSAVDNGISTPGAGDCWGCAFTEGHNGDLPGFAMGDSHFLAHVEEGYYVPSLLWNAIKSRGYVDPAFIWQVIQGDIRRGDARFLKDVLRSYFRKVKQKMLANAS